MTTAERDVGDKYVLPTCDKDAARLDVIQEVYGPVSIRALEAAELGDARRAVRQAVTTDLVSPSA